MSYGSSKWDKPVGRALAAASSKRKRTKTAPKSRRASAPRAKKKKTASARKPTERKQRACKYGPRGADGFCPKKPKKGRKASAKAVPLYDPQTGKIAARVKRGSEEFADLIAEGMLERKPRMVSRYNPETGRKQSVPESSDAANDWPTRKPAKTLSGLVSQGAKIGGSAGAGYVGTRVAVKAERKLKQTVGRALEKGVSAGGKVLAAATGASAGAVAATIIAGALIGWNLGKAINYAQAHVEDRLDAALRNYVNARKEAERRLGRKLTQAELRTMYAAYKAVVVRLKANDPTTYLRPGAE